MNRRGFLKRIGIFGAATVIAPHLIIEPTVSTEAVSIPVDTGTGLFHQLRQGNTIKYGALTKAHIREAVEYVFNQKPEGERQIKFYGGREFYKQFNSLMYAN